MTAAQIKCAIVPGWNDVTIQVHVPGHARPFTYGVSAFWGPWGATTIAALMKHLRERVKDYSIGREKNLRIEIVEIHPLARMHGKPPAPGVKR